MGITFNRAIAGFIVLIIGILFILDAVLRHGLGLIIGILLLILGLYMIIGTDKVANTDTEVKK
jgi:uncharacterized membrane protein YfcA